MPLLIILFPIAEIFLFYKVSQAYSFWDALLWIIMAGGLGALVIRLQGKATLLLLQKELAQGKIPANHLMHRSFVILGGILLFVPGFLSDILGVAAILPGTRHLMVAYLKAKVARGLFKGRVFTSSFGFGAPGGDFHFRHGPTAASEERDAQVVDIEPIEITHTKKSDP